MLILDAVFVFMVVPNFKNANLGFKNRIPRVRNDAMDVRVLQEAVLLRIDRLQGRNTNQSRRGKDAS
jgi:hypothetical protein